MRTVEDTIILGHESAGIITEVGSKVTNVVVGDRVAIEPTMYCKQCATTSFLATLSVSYFALGAPTVN